MSDPDIKAYGDSWYAATMVEAPPRPSLSLDLDVDVCVLGELGCEIEGWPTERVRAVLRSERYFNAINYLQAITIHPLNYALALAAAAERDGARIFEHTPALSIDPAGVRKRIVTPHARLRANHVVLCGNAQIGELGPGVWLASGFGGHGLNTTALAGNLIARAIVDGDETWRQFTPFELVWAGGILGRATMQLYYWFKRARDGLAERRAHAREVAHQAARQA